VSLINEYIATTGNRVFQSIGLCIWSYLKGIINGSGTDGMAGAVTVLYHGKENQKTLCYCLGLLTKHATYEAKVVGITLVMQKSCFERNA
jgi:hypothetical protein